MQMKKIEDIASLGSSNRLMLYIYFFKKFEFNRAADVLVEKDDMEGIGKPRVIKLKEDRALNLLSDDEFPGFLFVKVNLFCVNPPIRLPLERNIKTQEF